MKKRFLHRVSWLLWSVVIVLIGLFCLIRLLEGKEVSMIELTQSQKAVLKSAGASDEYVEKGVLSNHEVRVLEALDYAQTYLDVRYPGEQFCFSGMDNSTIRRTIYVFEGNVLHAPDERFSVKVENKHNGERVVVTESHYNDKKKNELISIVSEAFDSLDCNVYCNLEIVGLYGEDYDPQKHLREILKSGRTLVVSGEVYVVDCEAFIDVSKQITQILCEEGISGGFRLCNVECIILKDSQEIDKTKTRVMEKTFVSLPETINEVK